VAERERRRAELEAVVPPPLPVRAPPRFGFAELAAVIALLAAIAAWLR